MFTVRRSDGCRRQILTSKVDPRAVRVNGLVRDTGTDHNKELDFHQNSTDCSLAQATPLVKVSSKSASYFFK